MDRQQRGGAVPRAIADRVGEHVVHGLAADELLRSGQWRVAEGSVGVQRQRAPHAGHRGAHVARGRRLRADRHAEHGDRVAIGVAGRHRAGDGGIVQRFEGRAALGQVGETAQLEGGAVELAAQAHRPQRGFQVGPGHQGIAVGLERFGQRAQQGSALRPAAAAPHLKGLVRGAHAVVDVLAGRGGQGFWMGGAGARVEGLQLGGHGLGRKKKKEEG